MACCGKKREEAQVAASSAVLFQYTGRSALTVAGPISGRRYHFPRTDATLPVDPRDAAALSGVPHLRRVRSN